MIEHPAPAPGAAVPAERLAGQAVAAWRLRDRARAAARARPGHPAPLALAGQAASLALAAQWFAREPPGTQQHAEPLVRARLRALNTELEHLQ